MYGDNENTKLVDKQKLLGFIKHRERDRTVQEGAILQLTQGIIIDEESEIRFLNSQLEILRLLCSRAIIKKTELNLDINEEIE